MEGKSFVVHHKILMQIAVAPAPTFVPSVRHSGLDPESRRLSAALRHSGFRRNDELTFIANQVPYWSTV